MYRSPGRAWDAASWQAVAPAQSPDTGRKAGLGQSRSAPQSLGKNSQPQGRRGRKQFWHLTKCPGRYPWPYTAGCLHRTHPIEMPPGEVTSPVIPPNWGKGLLAAINAGAMNHPATLARKEPPRTSVIQHRPELRLCGPAAGGPLPAPAGEHPSSEESPLQAASYSSFS